MRKNQNKFLISGMFSIHECMLLLYAIFKTIEIFFQQIFFELLHLLAKRIDTPKRKLVTKTPSFHNYTDKASHFENRKVLKGKYSDRFLFKRIVRAKKSQIAQIQF